MAGSSVVRRLKTMEMVRRASMGMTLVNVSDEPVIFPHNAMYYTIPPTGPWQAPKDLEPKLYDGTLVVRDVYGVDSKTSVQYRRDRRMGRNPAPPDKTKLITSAVDIVAHALAKLQQRGVFVLSGDEAEDKTARELAAGSWLEFKKKICERSVAGFRKRTSNFFADPRNAGQIPPAPTDSEEMAQIWLDRYKLGRMGRKKHVCTFCGFQTNDDDIMTIHMQASHPAAEPFEPEEKPEKPPEPDTSDEPAIEKRRGRPPNKAV